MPDKKVETQDKDKKVESLEDSTQQTNTQVDPPIDDNAPPPIDPNYVADLERRIGEQQIQFRTLQRLAEENTRIREETQPTPAPRDVVADRNAFYGDPIGKLDERLDARDAKILKQMEKMLAPLQQVAASFKTNSEYDRLKAIVKNDPIFGKGLKDPDVEAQVDAIMRSGVEVTEDNIKSAVSQAFGIKAMRGGNGRTTTITTQDRVDPPQVPASRIRSQVPEQTRELTEDDRLGMKFAKLNPNNPEDVKTYWDLMNDETMTLSVHSKKGEAK